LNLEFSISAASRDQSEEANGKDYYISTEEFKHQE
jgi:guanylate kinase